MTNTIKAGKPVDYDSFASTANRALQDSKTKESGLQMSKDNSKVYFSKRRSFVGELMFKVVCSVATRLGSDLKEKYGESPNKDRQEKAAKVFQTLVLGGTTELKGENHKVSFVEEKSLKASYFAGNLKHNSAVLNHVMENREPCSLFLLNMNTGLNSEMYPKREATVETPPMENEAFQNVNSSDKDYRKDVLEPFVKGVFGSIIEKSTGLFTVDKLVVALDSKQDELGPLWNNKEVDCGISVINDSAGLVKLFHSLADATVNRSNYSDGDNSVLFTEIENLLVKVKDLDLADGVRNEIRDIQACMIKNKFDEKIASGEIKLDKLGDAFKDWKLQVNPPNLSGKEPAWPELEKVLAKVESLMVLGEEVSQEPRASD